MDCLGSMRLMQIRLLNNNSLIILCDHRVVEILQEICSSGTCGDYWSRTRGQQNQSLARKCGSIGPASIDEGYRGSCTCTWVASCIIYIYTWGFCGVVGGGRL